MAKRKRVLESPPNSSPGTKKRANVSQKPAATVAEAPPDQDHSVQQVPQDAPQEVQQDVQNDVAQDVLEVVPQEDPRDQISIANSANSPLLRLPAEIRNEIFAYVYAGVVYELELETKYGNRRCVLSGSGTYRGRCEVHSFLVCRQVHAETALLPYELGWFVFEVVGWCPRLAVVRMRSFLERRSPRQLHAIGKVTLWRAEYNHHRFWIQTRTAAYWLAKLDEMVFASGAEMYFGVPKYLDIADFGPSDS